MKKSSVVVGMSGGVDSSVAAALLLEQGYDVHAVFMKNWEEDDTETYCRDAEDIEDAKKICERLKLPLQVVNFSKLYWDRVFSLFLNEYQVGRTPNPDVLCNSEIKFKAFLEYAEQQGAEYIATGHYARKSGETEARLLKGCDPEKDQSYFLYALNQHQLQKSLFPVGYMTKSEVRRIAKKMNFSIHAKKGSTGICFIGERPFKAFLQSYLPAQPGNIETLEGKRIGKHDGLMYYTLGQRQGLKVGGLVGYAELPWYVATKDLQRNVLVVVQGKNHPALFSKNLTSHKIQWISGIEPAYPFSCSAKVRYRQKEQPCRIEKEGIGYKVSFQTPQRAITPGQSVVFYEGEVCLGGALIEPASL